MMNVFEIALICIIAAVALLAVAVVVFCKEECREKYLICVVVVCLLFLAESFIA